MPVAYLAIIITAFIFGRFHWPFAHILMIGSMLVMCADLIVQLIRLMMKKTDISVLFGSIALSFLSIGYAFISFGWPGAFYTGIFGILVSAAYVVYWLISGRKPTIRFVIVLLIMMFLGVLLTMKPSAVYCLRNNIDPQDSQIPVFSKHHLAWMYHLEDDDGAAMQLLLDEKKYVEGKLELHKQGKLDADYVAIYRQDLAIIDQAIVDLNQNRWNNYVPLLPKDYNSRTIN